MKRFLKEVWHFIWEDDSLLSWIVNVILAFVLVKFIVYPALGFMLGTGFPVVAVISGSMEHHGLGFDAWWDQSKGWYLQNDISKSDMQGYIFTNGFSKGDIIMLVGSKPGDIKRGDVVVYNSDNYKYPIIHRVTRIGNTEGIYEFTAKGDNNPVTDPTAVHPNQVLGKAVFRVPLLGWVKILFTELVEWVNALLMKFVGGI